MGKTRLALAVADTVRDHFRDGIGFVDLSPVPEPGLVLPSIGRALGLRAGGACPITETIRRHMRHRQVLLVLDTVQLLPRG